MTNVVTVNPGRQRYAFCDQHLYEYLNAGGEFNPGDVVVIAEL